MWVSKKKMNELNTIILYHERDLKEQLEVNRKLKKEIEKLAASLNELKEAVDTIVS